jgi:hypothetical protein
VLALKALNPKFKPQTHKRKKKKKEKKKALGHD